MRAYVTRESVCAADDIDPPHVQQLRGSDDWTWESLVHHVWQGAGLPLRTHSPFQSRSGSILASTMGASATVRGLCHAAERLVRSVGRRGR
jgi:hypothetical protein